MKIKPFPFINDEKLDTQNGIKNKRNVCQGSAFAPSGLETLSIKAKPMITLIPMEFSQMWGGRVKVEKNGHQIPDKVAPKNHLAFCEFAEVPNHGDDPYLT